MKRLIPALLALGCGGAPEPCSADALETQVRLCEALIATAPTVAEAQAEAATCVASLHAWHARCGGEGNTAMVDVLEAL